jgi:hypothetical protein
MHKYFLVTFLIIISVTGTKFINAQGCLNTNSYPVATFFPVPNTWTAIDTCNKAGDYAKVNVIQGGLYTFSTRQYDGSNVNYDSQLTLRLSSGEILAYGDDSGPNELQSSLYWLADTTAIVEIHLNQYECASNDSCSKIMVYYDAPVGLSELQNQNVFNIYPNPTNGDITIDFSSHLKFEVYHLQLFNLQGQLIDEVEITNSQNIFSFPQNILKGIYQIMILDDHKKNVHRQLVILK